MTMTSTELKQQEKALFDAFYAANYHGDKATAKNVLKQLENCLYQQRKAKH
jgi:hypothetical protein